MVCLPLKMCSELCRHLVFKLLYLSIGERSMCFHVHERLSTQDSTVVVVATTRCHLKGLAPLNALLRGLALSVLWPLPRGHWPNT